MLVLTRKRDERILIGSTVVVTVVKIGRDKVRLGIEAPPHVLVDRPEIRRRREANPQPLRSNRS